MVLPSAASPHSSVVVDLGEDHLDHRDVVAVVIAAVAAAAAAVVVVAAAAAEGMSWASMVFVPSVIDVIASCLEVMIRCLVRSPAEKND